MIGSLVVDAAGRSKVVSIIFMILLLILTEVNPPNFRFSYIHSEIQYHISKNLPSLGIPITMEMRNLTLIKLVFSLQKVWLLPS